MAWLAVQHLTQTHQHHRLTSCLLHHINGGNQGHKLQIAYSISLEKVS